MFKIAKDFVKKLDSIYLSHKHQVDELIGVKGQISDRVKSYWSSNWFWFAVVVLIMSALYTFGGEIYAYKIRYPISMAAIVIGFLCVKFIFKLFILRSKILGKKSILAQYKRKLFRKFVAFAIKKAEKEKRNLVVKALQRRAYLLLVLNRILLLLSFVVYALIMLTSAFNPLSVDHQAVLDLISGQWWFGGILLAIYFSIFLTMEFKIELAEVVFELQIAKDKTLANAKISNYELGVHLENDVKVKVKN
ncbi:hypothetical protein [Vibrio alginolyticus]|uniref:hypothetical protein n=1 Tax=Vibrio alginolyticus TaxID=663 RepID=UPI00215B8842|nr:hypothetical protein [Vibrio alginolyticus]MCR9504826.1 hypothetical protein [Vibrio alginolyticus]